MLASESVSRLANAEFFVSTPGLAALGETKPDSISVGSELPPKALELPDPLLFAGQLDARLKIKEPFAVKLSRSKEGVTAYVAEIEEFGYGSSTGEALWDLSRTISELYFSLKADAAKLSADLASVLAVLDRHIEQTRT